MQQADIQAVDGDPHRLGYLFGGDAVYSCFFFVDLKAVFCLVVLDIPVDVDDAVGLFEDAANIPGDLDLSFIGGAVDLGNDGLKNGRAGRNLGYFDVRTVFLCDLLQGGPDAFCNVVTLQRAFVF